MMACHLQEATRCFCLYIDGVPEELVGGGADGKPLDLHVHQLQQRNASFPSASCRPAASSDCLGETLVDLISWFQSPTSR